MTNPSTVIKTVTADSSTIFVGFWGFTNSVCAQHCFAVEKMPSCTPNCASAKCSSPGLCDVCASGFGNKLSSDGLTSTCIRCSDAMPNCLKCTSADFCTVAKDGWYISDDFKTLKQCKSTCATCISANQCITCSNPSFAIGTDVLNPGDCGPSCAAGKYSNSTTGQCLDCSLGCATCRGQNYCSTCSPGFY